MKHTRKTSWAFTLVELLVVVVVVAVCAAALFPAFARTKAPSLRIYCVNNLKGIAQAMQIWGQDHQDAFPQHVTIANGGYADYIGQRVIASTQAASRGVFGDFACLSNELVSPKVLICPAENESRLPATTFASTAPGLINAVPFTNDLNVSYFLGVDAAEINPRMILTGDHNMGSDGNLVPNRGFVNAPSSYSPDFKVSLGTNFVADGGVGWLRTMHSAQGNVALADGGVLELSRFQLHRVMSSSGDSGGNSGFNFTSPMGCFGPSVNRIQFP
jgi:prepilin-type N-terminal cleavage/methylation domain-containing protein